MTRQNRHLTPDAIVEATLKMATQEGDLPLSAFFRLVHQEHSPLDRLTLTLSPAYAEALRRLAEAPAQVYAANATNGGLLLECATLLEAAQ